MSKTETPAAPQTVVREDVTTTSTGEETPTCETGIIDRVRSDCDECVNANPGRRTTHHEASGPEFAGDDVSRNGTIRRLAPALQGVRGVRTHTVGASDPEDVERPAGIRIVGCHGPESRSGSGFPGRDGTQIGGEGPNAATTCASSVAGKAVSDRDGANGSLRSGLTFGATGRPKQSGATAAWGRVTTKEVLTGSVRSNVIDDAGDAFIWARRTAAFDGQGQCTPALTTRDNGEGITTKLEKGIRGRQSNDRASASAIGSERASDATGGLSWTEWTTAKGVFVSANYADGRATMRAARDIADAFAFDTHTQSYLYGKLSVAVTAFESGVCEPQPPRATS